MALKQERNVQSNCLHRADDWIDRDDQLIAISAHFRGLTDAIY
jgi:hypothetical protein